MTNIFKLSLATLLKSEKARTFQGLINIFKFSLVLIMFFLKKIYSQSFHFSKCFTGAFEHIMTFTVNVNNTISGCCDLLEWFFYQASTEEFHATVCHFCSRFSAGTDSDVMSFHAKPAQNKKILPCCF